MRKMLALLAATGSLATASMAVTPIIQTASAVTATVPNMFVRDCSYITSRCTGYWQTNGSYNPRVPSTYQTRWVWRWI
jgi:hypothetical protein